MKRLRKQTLDGNVETLVLTVLEAGPSYGYQIVKELNLRSEGILRLGEGTIYPVLYRLEERKMISAKWRLAENGRRRKYYRLTPKGRKILAGNRQQWKMLVSVMEKVLVPAESLLPNFEPTRTMARYDMSKLCKQAVGNFALHSFV
jgi:PadR family transcriptional regulator PadR